MDVSQIRVARQELQDEVLSLFEDFQRRTGLAVIGCEVRTIRAASIEDDFPHCVTSAVVVETEQI